MPQSRAAFFIWQEFAGGRICRLAVIGRGTCRSDYREDWVKNYRFNYFNVARIENGSATSFNSNSDRIRLRLYLDDPRFYSRELFDAMRPEALPVTNDVHILKLASFPSGTSATDGTEWRQAYATSFSTSGRYFNGRVLTLLGVRHDWNRTYEYNGTRRLGSYNEEIAPPKRRDALLGEYGENMELHLENTCYTGGITVKLTEGLNFERLRATPCAVSRSTRSRPETLVV